MIWLLILSATAAMGSLVWHLVSHENRIADLEAEQARLRAALQLEEGSPAVIRRRGTQDGARPGAVL
jgi:hypothetical protein